jgi:hypothetical protein
VISAFVFRCDGRDEDGVRCACKKTVRTRTVGARDLNSVSKYLHGKLKWGISGNSKGSTHFCKRCNKKRMKALAIQVEANRKARDEFLAKVQRRSEKKRKRKAEAEREERRLRKLRKLKKKGKRRHGKD